MVWLEEVGSGQWNEKVKQQVKGKKIVLQYLHPEKRGLWEEY